MKFKLWLEAIQSLDSVYQTLSNTIQSSPDYNTAIASLNKTGINTPTLRPIGSRWAANFYDYLKGNPEGPENPKLDQQLNQTSDQIGKLPNLKELSVDVMNPWHSFQVEQKQPKSEIKLHIKIPEENLGLITNIAKFVSNNPTLFYQLKYSYSGNSFVSRRDNAVLYLTKEGEEKAKQIYDSLSSMGVSAELGKDFVSKEGKQLSTTESAAHRLAAILLRKPGAPAPSWYLGTAAREFIETDPIASGKASKTPAASSEAPVTPKLGEHEATAHMRIQLSPKNGPPLNIGIGTPIGRRTLGANPDSKFFGDTQFRLDKDSKHWYITPLPNENSTFLNNKPLNTKSIVKNGDTISVGNPKTMRTAGQMQVGFI